MGFIAGITCVLFHWKLAEPKFMSIHLPRNKRCNAGIGAITKVKTYHSLNAWSIHMFSLSEIPFIKLK